MGKEFSDATWADDKPGRLITFAPKGWLIDIDEDEEDLKKKVLSALSFIRKDFKSSYPVCLYGKRGFKAGLVDYLNEVLDGYEFRLDIPELKFDPGMLDLLELRDYQRDAAMKLLTKGYGIVASPTASGKTRMELAVVAVYPKPMMVIVPDKGLLYQFKENFERAGHWVGLYGDGHKNLGRPITIITAQSLATYSEPIKEHLKKCKSILMDEVHHGTKKLYAILGRCPALYRAGFSATPWKTADKLAKARLIANFGGVVYDGSKDPRVAPYVQRPKVYVMTRNTRPANLMAVMQAVKSRNYVEQRRQAIVQDKDRNRLILKLAELFRLRGMNTFILVAWREHIEELRPLAVNMGSPIYFLTGETPAREREVIYSRIGGPDSMTICGTVGAEGVDIPHLNIVILADVGKSEIKVIQSIGRAARKAEGKTVAAIVDIAEPLYSDHFKARKKIYKTEDFDIQDISNLLTKLARAEPEE